MYFIDNNACHLYSGIYYTEIDKRQYGVLRWRYPGGVKAAEQNVVAYSKNCARLRIVVQKVNWCRTVIAFSIIVMIFDTGLCIALIHLCRLLRCVRM